MTAPPERAAARGGRRVSGLWGQAGKRPRALAASCVERGQLAGAACLVEHGDFAADVGDVVEEQWCLRLCPFR